MDIRKAFSTLALTLALTIAIEQTMGCKQLSALVPAVDNVEALVLADLKAGDALPQIEADVARLLCGDAGTLCADVVETVDAALVLLINAGALPAWLLPIAKQHHALEAHKLAARASAEK